MATTPLSCDPGDRLDRACRSLEGLSVGDAFGERFFVNPAVVESLIRARAVPAPPWRFTDDTEMAVAVVADLRRHREIHQDSLALDFAARYDGSRGYGPAMHGLLACIRAGESWRDVAPRLFSGQGSFGNGAAMRVAPLGAYFADDLESIVEQAGRSAEVTHVHAEAVAGAIAVGVAAAWACRLRGAEPPDCQEFLDLILPLVPDSVVREKIRHARHLDPDASVAPAVATLGNGERVSAQDTVPFALWCAGQRLAHFEDALWLTVSGLGDRDTTCAIVGGIVAGYTGAGAIPLDWLQAREPLPDWHLRDLPMRPLA